MRSESSEPAPAVSVIVPVGPQERGPFGLLSQLERLPADWEVVLALCEPRDDLEPSFHGDIYTVISSPGRAIQMNRAAEVARGRWLWFLHLDSTLTPAMVREIGQALLSQPEALHYFRLGFAADGKGPLSLNAWGANFRSRWLGVPFGDQGLCLRASDFRRLRGYPEEVAYGEDHLLVWRARQAGIGLHGIDAVLTTSASKYRRQGWLRLTLLYQWRWLRQALPQWLRLVILRRY
ncbi:hypothetical protein [Marinobacterium aestuariivivens]|uniref:Glycosyl transferase family 2 n=1 Tax=Marinobacterium aestuariivivens TaxID=1698799 RepID=A0ABW2A7Z7_9GAMM